MNSTFKPGELVEVNAGMNITKFGTIQRMTESTIYVKHYGGVVVGYKPEHIQKHVYKEATQMHGSNGLQSEFAAFAQVMESAAKGKAKEIEKDTNKAAGSKMALGEEEEQLDELNKDTLYSYRQKADKDLDAQGNQLDTNVRAGKAKEANKNSLKVSKRMAGIDRAVGRLNKEETELDEIADYMFSEEFEQLDEISKETIRSYWNKTDASMKKRTSRAKQAETIVKRIKGRSQAADRLKGDKPTSEENVMEGALAKDITNAVNKRENNALNAKYSQKNEETDLSEAMIGYSDFQAKIDMHRKAGNKVVNDKYTDKKATYTTIDQDGVGKKIIHTPDGTKQEHLGQMKGEDDKAETTDKQTEKRGRGRPSGSKSGAR